CRLQISEVECGTERDNSRSFSSFNLQTAICNRSGGGDMRHFLSLHDVGAAELEALLAEAARLKADLKRGHRPPLLAGRVLGMIFEKPSLRTRASFEAAMAQMGGSTVFLSPSDGDMGQREPVADFARTLSSYADVVVLRTFRHETVEEFAAHSRVPV